MSFDTNFVDRVAFASGVSKYVEEAQKHAALVRVSIPLSSAYTPTQNDLLDEGRKYACMLYTWRSCSRCIPPV